MSTAAPRTRTDAPAPGDPVLLPGRVAERCASAATACAVRQGERSLSYADLDRLSARVAGRLLKSGLPPESRVALLVDRTVEAPALILGVLRAGCVYVPLDPAHPAERLVGMLRDCRAAVLVSDRPPLGPGLPPATVVLSPGLLLDERAEEEDGPGGPPRTL